MRYLSWILLLATGCSTAPVIDFYDHFFPAKVQSAAGEKARGGVCDPVPQGRGAGGPGAPVPAGAPGFLPPTQVPGPGELPPPAPPTYQP